MEDEVKSQVSMLLAEAAGYDVVLAKVEGVRKEAESQLQDLAVRINASEAQLDVFSVQNPMLKARLLSDEGERLLAQVDALLHDNTQVIEGNPVRTVRELLAASRGPTRKDSHLEAAETFLAQKLTPREPIMEEQTEPAAEKTQRAEVERQLCHPENHQEGTPSERLASAEEDRVVVVPERAEVRADQLLSADQGAQVKRDPADRAQYNTDSHEGGQGNVSAEPEIPGHGSSQDVMSVEASIEVERMNGTSSPVPPAAPSQVRTKPIFQQF